MGWNYNLNEAPIDTPIQLLSGDDCLLLPQQEFVGTITYGNKNELVRGECLVGDPDYFYRSAIVAWKEYIKEERPKEPCEDCISRSEAIRVSSGYCHWSTIPDELAKLPSFTPANRWIPIREKMPDRSGFYLVTTEYDEVYCDYYNENNFNRHEIIIAWMPMPDPYKGVADEEEIQTKGRMPDNLAKGLT